VKNIKKAHLTQYVKNNTHAKLCIKMCAALALLPAVLIEEGFQTVKQHARDNNIHIDVFLIISPGSNLNLKTFLNFQ